MTSLSLSQLIGESPEIVSLREQIRRLIQRQRGLYRPLPILILGEAGTGKAFVARQIHAEGPRAQRPFVQVSCAALPESLFEAELFGFEKGAPASARGARPGLFHAAGAGTIFLDEVGRLSLGNQAKLLKVVEQRVLRRIGSTQDEPVDAWIITAASDDLLTSAREDRFREDLYHRLAAVAFRLPPLRRRGRDILLLAERFLARACTEYGAPPMALGPSARAALLAHSWPGNVRELANLMERVVLFSEATDVTAETFDLTEAPGSEQTPAASPNGRAGPEDEDVRDAALRARAAGSWSALARESVARPLRAEPASTRAANGSRRTGWLLDLGEPSEAGR
ncbi:MAG TPA: sigma 54-interacting transcriptional regulator [Methylomirabilota bacterium]|jgi:Nif-specific regulatory protein|nr:sigma 54-interacting transcriptional regulator [Methylomirabilota bacterium]